MIGRSPVFMEDGHRLVNELALARSQHGDGVRLRLRPFRHLTQANERRHGDGERPAQVPSSTETLWLPSVREAARLNCVVAVRDKRHIGRRFCSQPRRSRDR